MNAAVSHGDVTSSVKYGRSPSKTTQDSGIYSDEEKSSSSEDSHEEDYHFVEALKVLGVHKKETPKVHYLFVIIVRWNDKSQVTVYRKWSEIKDFQRTVVKATKQRNNQNEVHHFIKKTADRVKKAARFRHGTIKKLDMIDSLNNFFQAIVHYEDTAHSANVRQFFKPTESDLDSMSWSANGRTYFYVTHDILGEKNDDFNADGADEEYPDDPCDENIDPSKHINEQGTAIQQTQEEFNDALEIYNEADPNISWPINSSSFVAICDFDASAEDPKDNIIGLKKEEVVEVLEKNESGWWLVTRTNEEPKTKNGLNECGYVPASHLEMQARTVFTNTEYESFDSSCSGADDSVDDNVDDASSFSFNTNVSEEDKSIEVLKEDDNFSLPKRGVLQRLERVESLGSMSSINDSDWSASPFTSTESLASVDTPTPKPRRKKLAFIEKMNQQRTLSPLVHGQKCLTPIIGRHGFQSEDARITSLQGSMTPPIMKRSRALDDHRMTGSVQDLRSIAFSSPPLSRTSSLQSLSKRGTDYVSIKGYHAIIDDELSFESGSVLKVISRNSNGWWLASYKGKTGLVPSVNLKRYKDPIRTMSMQMLNNF